MKSKIVFLFFLFFSSFSFYSVEIAEQTPRFFLSSTNDNFSFGITSNKDDQLTASAEIHLTLPYFFCDLVVNSITNRGYSFGKDGIYSFVNGRYDEFFIKTGTIINLYNNYLFSVDFTPELGFKYFGNLGTNYVQNLNHKSRGISDVNLPYVKFSYPFVPILNVDFSLTAHIFSFLDGKINLKTENIPQYINEEEIKLSAIFGKEKTKVNIFCSYIWDYLFLDDITFKLKENASKGFSYGFIIDTGLFKIDYTSFGHNDYGFGTLSLDILNFSKQNWNSTDLNLYLGFAFLFDTEYYENKIESPSFNNFSFFYKNRYVSGFKINAVNPNLNYRIERDYEINTFGAKFQIPLSFTNYWITPFIEVGTGVASFGIRKLTNYISESNEQKYDFGTNGFWELESTLGFDLIPQGKNIFGSASYGLSAFAGTIFIPSYKKASEHIKKDLYRTEKWSLSPFEFIWGFSIHFGMDF